MGCAGRAGTTFAAARPAARVRNAAPRRASRPRRRAVRNCWHGCAEARGHALRNQLRLDRLTRLVEGEIMLRRIHVDLDRVSFAELAFEDTRRERVLDA